MGIMNSKYIIILFGICLVKAQRKCCEGTENAVRMKECVDGSNITGISCNKMYSISSEDNEEFAVDGNGSLLDKNETFKIEFDQYCLTKDSRTGDNIALVCFAYQESEEGSNSFVRAGCAIVSVIFLILTATVYILVPNLRDLQGKCLLHSITALAVAMLVLCILQFRLDIPDNGCHAAGYITMISFLATFTWLNTISFHIWRTTVFPAIPGTDKQWYILYCAYAYGMPAIVILIAIIAHHVPGDHIKPGIGEYSCWFSTRDAIWAYFYGPITFLLALNLIFFCWTIKKLWTDVRELQNNEVKIKSLRFKCLLYIKLFFIMGLSWIFEVLSFAFDSDTHFIRYVWMVTDLINALQGVLIFTILVVFRKKALSGLAKRGMCCIKLPVQWKTLQDEECDELVEEKQLTIDVVAEEQFQKTKENHNSA